MRKKSGPGHNTPKHVMEPKKLFVCLLFPVSFVKDSKLEMRPFEEAFAIKEIFNIFILSSPSLSPSLLMLKHGNCNEIAFILYFMNFVTRNQHRYLEEEQSLTLTSYWFYFVHEIEIGARKNLLQIRSPNFCCLTFAFLRIFN